MDVGEPKRTSIAEFVRQRRSVWSTLVDAHSLTAPRDVDLLLGQSAQLADLLTRSGSIQPLTISSVTKLRQAGFQETIDTEVMLRKWIARYQDLKLIPPRAP